MTSRIKTAATIANKKLECGGNNQIQELSEIRRSPIFNAGQAPFKGKVNN